MPKGPRVQGDGVHFPWARKFLFFEPLDAFLVHFMTIFTLLFHYFSTPIQFHFSSAAIPPPRRNILQIFTPVPLSYYFPTSSFFTFFPSSYFYLNWWDMQLSEIMECHNNIQWTTFITKVCAKNYHSPSFPFNHFSFSFPPYHFFVFSPPLYLNFIFFPSSHFPSPPPTIIFCAVFFQGI